MNKKASLIFVINEIKKICESKIFNECLINCELIRQKLLDDYIDDFEFYELIKQSDLLIDRLLLLIEIEKRYTLYPFNDIKEEAYKIGKLYMENFIKWIKPEDNPEKIMGILEEEIFKLNQMKKVLLEIQNQ